MKMTSNPTFIIPCTDGFIRPGDDDGQMRSVVMVLKGEGPSTLDWNGVVAEFRTKLCFYFWIYIRTIREGNVDDFWKLMDL